jgi:hypothetical protein
MRAFKNKEDGLIFLMIDAACLEDSMEARKEIATINSRNDIVV